MDPRRRAISFAGLTLGLPLPALAQEIQERTIRFGHRKLALIHKR